MYSILWRDALALTMSSRSCNPFFIKRLHGDLGTGSVFCRLRLSRRASNLIQGLIAQVAVDAGIAPASPVGFHGGINPRYVERGLGFRLLRCLEPLKVRSMFLSQVAQRLCSAPVFWRPRSLFFIALVNDLHAWGAQEG